VLPLLATFDSIKPCPDIIMAGFFAFTHLLFETFSLLWVKFSFMNFLSCFIYFSKIICFYIQRVEIALNDKSAVFKDTVFFCH